jgi:Ca2+:H+ antiporter
MPKIQWLLLFLPVALLLEFAHVSDLAVFITSALAIIPLAGILGEATEVLAEKTGPRMGGLLNASLGNAAELIITLVAIRAGQIELVRASITGSILGNLLLVLGFSMLLGGLKNGRQTFDRRNVDTDATMTILALIAMSIPSIFNNYIEPNDLAVEDLSLATAGVVLILYILFIIYTLKNSHSGPIEERLAGDVASAPSWSMRKALGLMTFSMAGMALMSELLVGSVQAATDQLGLTPFFVGIIIVPIIGNVAEHLVSVQAAMKNRLDLSLSIALGSSLQIALFVTPILVFVSLIIGKPLTLQFNQLELIALTAASLISALVSLDGESNWLEGAMLLAVYGMLGLAFFFLPIGM